MSTAAERRAQRKNEIATVLAHPDAAAALQDFRRPPRADAEDVKQAIAHNNWLDKMATDPANDDGDELRSRLASIAKGDSREVALRRAAAFAALTDLRRALLEQPPPVRPKGPKTHEEMYLLVARLAQVWRKVTDKPVKVGARTVVQPDGSKLQAYSGAVLDFACHAVADLPDKIRPSRESLHHYFKNLSTHLGGKGAPRF